VGALGLSALVAMLPERAAWAVDGDAERGAKLFATCYGCHGIEGYRNPYPSFRVPMLGGQHPQYVYQSLMAYRQQQRSHATMHAQAASYTEQDLKDIAAFIGSLGEPRTGEPEMTEAARRGRDKAAACVACHGEQGISNSPEWPNLAGQYESYLLHSLRQYKSGARQNAVMAGLVMALSDQDMKDLAAFYAAQEGLFTVDRPD
jgi:cytochrome c553